MYFTGSPEGMMEWGNERMREEGMREEGMREWGAPMEWKNQGMHLWNKPMEWIYGMNLWNEFMEWVYGLASGVSLWNEMEWTYGMSYRMLWSELRNECMDE